MVLLRRSIYFSFFAFTLCFNAIHADGIDPVGSQVPSLSSSQLQDAANASSGSSISYDISENAPQGPEGILKGYAAIIEAESKYMEAVGRTRVFIAQAGLFDAQAASEWERAQELETLLERLQFELNSLTASETQANYWMRSIYRAGVAMSPIKRGICNSEVWSAFNWFIDRIIPPELLADTLSMAVPPLPKEEFYTWQMEGHEDADKGFQGGTAGDLLRFLKETGYSMKEFGQANIAILKFIGKLNDSALQQVTEVQKRLADLRRNTLSAWDLSFRPKNINYIFQGGGGDHPGPDMFGGGGGASGNHSIFSREIAR